MSEYAEKRRRTREAFLQAAFEALPGALGEGVVAALGPAMLARRAGLSRQTFYRHWPPDRESFLGDLVEYSLSPERTYESTILPDLLAASGTDPLTATELIRGAAMAEYEATLELRSLHREVVSWALLTDALVAAEVGAPGEPPRALRDAVGRYYAQITDDLVAVYEELLGGWGREMAPGTSVRQFAAVLTGLTEGMAMRWLVDPDLVPPSLFADVVLALVPAFTRPLPGPSLGPPASFFLDGDQATDRVDAGAASAVGAAPGATESSQRRSGRRRVERTRSAIVAAARTEFAIRGYGGATIGGIASAAGLSESTVYEHYGSKAGLAAASFAGGHAEAVAALRADGAAPLTRLHNHLGRVYALLVADRAGTKALFDAVMEVTVEGPPTSPTDPRVLVPLPDVMVPVISDAQAEGELGAGVDPWTIAGHLVGLLMLNVLMNPMEPEAACRRIEDLAFGGLYRESIGGDGPAGRV